MVRKQYKNSYYICPSNDFNYYFNNLEDSKLARAAVCFNDNIREREMNKRYKRFAHQPKVKRFNNYSFFSKCGEFILRKRKVNLKKNNIRKTINAYKDEVININNELGITDKNKFDYSLVDHHDYGLPLPVNKVSRIIGVFKTFSNTWYGRRAKIREENSLMSYAFHVFEEKFLSFRKQFNMSVFPGDFQYNINNMVDMCTPTPKEYSVKELLDGYFSRVNIDFVLPYFDKYERKTVLGLEVNYKAKPGILSKQLVGTTRNATTKYSKTVAYEYLGKIMDKKGEYVLDKSLYDYGGREKRVKSKFSDYMKPIKTRTICMQEDVPTLIGQSLTKYLMHGLQYLDDGFNYGGRLNGRKNWIKFIGDMEPDEWYIINGNADFIGHDNNVTERKIVVACSILRLSFPEGEEMDRLFYYVMSSAVFKRIVLPESNLIYEIEKGLPSGHSLTSILTTLISYGTFSTAINNVCNKKVVETGIKALTRKTLVRDSNLNNAGDDVAYKFNGLFTNEISNDIILNSGMKIDPLGDTVGYFCSMNELTRSTFLKKKYGNYNFSWNNSELYINLMFPTMKSLSFGNLSNSLLQIVESAPYDTYMNNMIKVLCCATLLDKSNFGRGYELRKIIDKEGGGVVKYMAPTFFTLSEGVNFIDHVASKVNLHYEDIDKILLEYEYKYSYFYDEEFGRVVENNTYLKVVALLDRINGIIERKKRLLSVDIPFKRHRKVHRLAVFDLEKKFIKRVDSDKSLIAHL